MQRTFDAPLQGRAFTRRGRAATRRSDREFQFTSVAVGLPFVNEENTMAAETTYTHHVDVTSDLLDRGIGLAHPNYLVLAERARAAAFEELGSPIDVMWRDGFVLLVRSIAIDYRKPIFAGARIAIVTSLRVVSESTIDAEQRFLLGGAGSGAVSRTDATRAECEMRARLVCANLVESKVDTLPRALRNALSSSIDMPVAEAAS
jgi:acyl-CoA thioesterase FadM